MDEITGTQLPPESRGSKRALEEERATWQTPPERIARREELIRKYGWQRLAPGLRL